MILYTAPEAEFFADETAELEGDQRGEGLARVTANLSEDVVASERLLQQFKHGDLGTIEVCWGVTRLTLLSRRNLERLKDVERFRDERRSETDEEMGAKGVWVADAMGHRQEVTIVLACEASRDKSARLRPRLDDEYCVGEPNHEAVAGGEGMDEIGRAAC